MAQILVMAGGTGGHVFPALATAIELIARGHQVSWLGSRESFESRLVPQHGIKIDTINVKGLRGNGLKRLLMAPVLLLRSLYEAMKVLQLRSPDLVLGMGGFASGPGGLAARLKGIPLVIHEQNAIPGVTNRLLAKIATRVCAAFPGAFGQRDVIVTGNPVRDEIIALESPSERFAGRDGSLRVLVVGGSLGAAALNETVPAALALLEPGQRPQVRHQAGRNKDADTRRYYKTAGVDAEVTAFIDDMAGALAWADLVVCRSGALTVSELAAVGVAAYLVPYPFAVDDHQTANGMFLADAGAAVVVQQRELTPNKLADFLAGAEREGLLRMAESGRKVARPDATASVATICEEVLHG